MLAVGVGAVPTDGRGLANVLLGLWPHDGGPRPPAPIGVVGPHVTSRFCCSARTSGEMITPC
jgi:hypothetical protein